MSNFPHRNEVLSLLCRTPVMANTNGEPAVEHRNGGPVEVEIATQQSVTRPKMLCVTVGIRECESGQPLDARWLTKYAGHAPAIQLDDTVAESTSCGLRAVFTVEPRPSGLVFSVPM